MVPFLSMRKAPRPAVANHSAPERSRSMARIVTSGRPGNRYGTGVPCCMRKRRLEHIQSVPSESRIREPKSESYAFGNDTSRIPLRLRRSNPDCVPIHRFPSISVVCDRTVLLGSASGALIRTKPPAVRTYKPSPTVPTHIWPEGRTPKVRTTPCTPTIFSNFPEGI